MRFKGVSEIIKSGNEFEKIISNYKTNGIESKINSVIKIYVEKASQITSPSYDLGHSEEEIKSKWKKYYLSKV